MTKARITGDGSVVEILQDGSERPLATRIDLRRVDATTEDEIAAQAAQDDAEAMRDAAAYARRVRRKTGLSQAVFAKRFPRGPARALLRIIDRSPEEALMALGPAGEQPNRK